MDESKLFRQFLAHYDAPAYVRRARAVQDAFEQLVNRCRKQRDEWLIMVRIRLSRLRGLAGTWNRLPPSLADSEQVAVLRHLDEELDPKPRIPIEPTSSRRVLRRALGELSESILHFNRRWTKFIREVDLTQANAIRDGYNRYFVLEKECAVGSVRLARQGFVKLEPLTTTELERLLPPLPVPTLSLNLTPGSSS